MRTVSSSIRGNNKIYIIPRDQISVTSRCYILCLIERSNLKTCSLVVKDLQTCGNSGIQIKANVCQSTQYDLLYGIRIVAIEIEYT